MRPREYTQEQIEFVRDNIKHMSTRNCAKAFTERFSESLSQTCLRRLMEKYGIEARSKEYVQTPIGTERYSKYYDCMIVKVADSCVAGMKKGSKEFASKRNNSWKLKQNLVWEQSTEKKLPRKHVVIFLDGNRMNYDPNNLYAVPLQVAGTIKKIRMNSEDPDIYKTALIWGELYFLLKKQRGYASKFKVDDETYDKAYKARQEEDE